MNKIIVKVKEIYGKRRIYPVCKNAKRFALIAGTTTLTDATIDYIKMLGYSIEVEKVEL